MPQTRNQLMTNDVQISPEQSLCLSCGLCCNGSIFMRVSLDAMDNVAALQAAGVEIRQKKKAVRMKPVNLFVCRVRLYGKIVVRFTKTVRQAAANSNVNC